MKCLRPLHITVTALVVSISAFAQQAASVPANAPYFESGVVANGVYSNDCLGFSLPIPSGWDVNENATMGGWARHRSDKSLVLLYLRQEATRSGIIVSAWDTAGHSGGAQEFVSSSVHAQVGIPGENRELVRDAFAVEYGGRQFYRSDYVAAMRNSARLYLSYLFTEFRGYFIGAVLASGSPEGLDRAADAFQSISLREDKINPKCIMSGGNPTWPLHIEKGVSEGLLIKKVPPDYPPIARQARIQGSVVLHAVIDTQGNIKDLTLVSGHTMLAAAAIEAVKQWKYRPYILQGQPVEVETQIVVNFSLSGG